MENGTPYASVIQSLKNPTLCDIQYISRDYLRTLDPDAQEQLLKEFRIKDYHWWGEVRNKPETESQMHAFICANASAISQSVSRVLYENDRNIQDVDDIALVDFDCALGLNTIAFIEHMRIIGQEKRIKEVLLIDDNKACLERAELLVSTVAPSITVETLMKPINQISPEEVKLE